MKMYVANVTEQFHQFSYRIPEVNQTRNLTIPPRAQVKLPDDMTREQVDAVVTQHAPYGMIAVEEVGSGTNRRRFSNLLYSLVMPVPGVRIELQYVRNHEVLVDRGKEIRKETAVASNLGLVAELDKRTRNTEMAGAEVSNFGAEVIEDERPDVSDSDRLSETYKVTGDATASKIAPKRGRGSRPVGG
jgi:hypothetical protein